MAIIIKHSKLPDCVTAARQTLTLLVGVQILVGQPLKELLSIKAKVLFLFNKSVDFTKKLCYNK